MTTDLERFLRSYQVAKNLLGVYWKHDGDYPELGRIRVENVEKATEEHTGTSICKKIVNFEAEHLRSVTHRYADGYAPIYTFDKRLF